MNHPKLEEWVPYLYGETEPEARRQLRAHLKGCSECRDQVQSWKRCLGRLDAWKLPGMKPRLEAAPVVKWAAAAVVVLCIGFALGHSGAARPDLNKLRATLEPQLRRQLKEEMAQLARDEVNKASSAILLGAGQQTEKLLAAYAIASESTRADDMDRLYLLLKREVDTVAVNTDAGLRQTEQQLVRLAGYTPSAGSPQSGK
jgi:hypothetical protein